VDRIKRGTIRFVIFRSRDQLDLIAPLISIGPRSERVYDQRFESAVHHQQS
jgi:hypothetical protein